MIRQLLGRRRKRAGGRLVKRKNICGGKGETVLKSGFHLS